MAYLGPLVILKNFSHGVIRWCTMHIVHLGILYVSNGASLIFAGNFLILLHIKSCCLISFLLLCFGVYVMVWVHPSFTKALTEPEEHVDGSRILCTQRVFSDHQACRSLQMFQKMVFSKPCFLQPATIYRRIGYLLPSYSILFTVYQF